MELHIYKTKSGTFEIIQSEKPLERNYFCPAPHHEKSVLDIDETNKTAVINPTKLAQWEAQRAAEKDAQKAEKLSSLQETNEIKAVDVDAMIDSMDKAKLKTIIKWLVKKQLGL